jgi:HAD superfamily hydrolase (TIGR01509 family)
VIFDCDGVLVDSERLVQDVDMRMIHALGWPITRAEIFDQHLGRSEADVTANIVARTGAPLPPTFVAERDAAYLEAFRTQLVAVAGVKEAILELQEQGWATCVGSSSSHARLRLTLGLTGLLLLFEGRIFSAQDVRHGKPAPDLFLHAAEVLGARPDQTIVVEDSPSGVEAARAAGMGVIAYAGLTPAGLLGAADAVVTDMAELTGAIHSQAAAVGDVDDAH